MGVIWDYGAIWLYLPFHFYTDRKLKVSIHDSVGVKSMLLGVVSVVSKNYLIISSASISGFPRPKHLSSSDSIENLRFMPICDFFYDL